jgi:hypothetical protein
MNWNEAKALLENEIVIGQHLANNGRYKIVKEIPPYQCKNFNNDKGFRIQVGETSFINIPFSMLKCLFEASVLNNGQYNNLVFAEFYPRELNNKPCYVHSVGKLFENAGVMINPENVNSYIVAN